MFGVDILAAEFEFARGYRRYRSNRAEVLLIRLEDLNRVAQKALSGFLGLEHVQVKRENDASENVYSDIYRTFREILSLPADYLDSVYSSAYSRHVYSEEELGRFRSRWR